MPDKHIETLKKLKATLDGVKAEGRENWERLLACMQAIDRMINEMQEAAEE